MASEIVLDSSAVVALLLEERVALAIETKIQRADVVLIGAPTVLETKIVMTTRRGRDASTEVREILDRYRTMSVAFTSEHESAATAAFLRFGKGRHPAALNYGDCMAYAVAKLANRPLLFTGADFSQTDVRAA